MDEPKLTIGMIYTSASKSSSKKPNSPRTVKSFKPSDPTSTRPNPDKHGEGEHKQSDEEDPLCPVCTADSPDIVLEYAIPEGGKSGQLVAPSGKIIYRLQLEVNEHDGELYRACNDQLIGAWTEYGGQLEEKLKFLFERHSGKWEFSPDDESWRSQVGTLPEHEFRWTDFKDNSDADIAQGLAGPGGNDEKARFSVRCIDASDRNKRTVCVIANDSYYHGTLTIPRDIIATLDQLEEMVTVSLAVMNRLKNEIKDDVDNDGQATTAGLRQTLRN